MKKPHLRLIYWDFMKTENFDYEEKEKLKDILKDFNKSLIIGFTENEVKGYNQTTTVVFNTSVREKKKRPSRIYK